MHNWNYLFLLRNKGKRSHCEYLAPVQLSGTPKGKESLNRAEAKPDSFICGSPCDPWWALCSGGDPHGEDV